MKVTIIIVGFLMNNYENLFVINIKNTMSLEDEYTELIKSITSIQNNEKYLYERLRSIQNSNIPNDIEIVKIKKNLGELRKIRKTLYDSLKRMYNRFSNDISHHSDVKNGVIMVDMINEEIQQMENNLNTLRIRKQNNQRLASIKNYEQKRYKSRIELLKLIVYMLVALIFVFILQRIILPYSVAQLLYIIILSIGIIYILYKVYDMNMRDNFDYDKYDWKIKAEMITPEKYNDIASKRNSKYK